MSATAIFSLRRILILLMLLLSSSACLRDVQAQPIERGPEMRALSKILSLHGKPSVALVLSGGGAKGLAHIGVLEILDSAHIPIDLIVGTSMGAAIGGLYAAGYTPKELEQFAERTNWSDILDFDDDSHRTERMLDQKDNDRAVLSLRFTGFFKPVLPQAISSGERLTMLLNAMVISAPNGTAQDFTRDLKVPFIALATDIVTGQRRIITKGDLTSAMRASITLPLRFTPLSTDSAILVDGGLLSNVPVDVAKDSAGAEIAIASNTSAALRTRDDLSSPWDVADQVITLMMLRLSRESLRRADAVITPAMVVEAADFQNVPGIIESGREAARAMLPKLQQLVKTRSTNFGGLEPMMENDALDGNPNVEVVTYGHSVPDTVRRMLRSIMSAAPATRTVGREVASIVETFHEQGFTLVHVDSITHSQPATTTIYLDEGRIGNVIVGGNATFHPEVVLREFPLSRDDIFRAQDAERGLRNLTSTGFFDFASIEVIHSDTGERLPIVKLTVQERAPNILRLGLFADNEYGAQFSTELANENLFGSGTSISLKGGVGSLDRYGAVTFKVPRLFRSTTTLLAQLYSGYKDISVYNTEPNIQTGKITSSITDVVREARDIGARVKVGGDVGRVAELSFEIRHERQRYFSVRTPDPETTIDDITALRGELDIDSRNDRAFPQEGTYSRAYYEIGNKLIGGRVSYTKIFAEISQAVRLSSLHTLIPHLAVGFGDLTLPRMEQFELGGIESFYGLNEDESRGRQMVMGSLTYQIAVPHALLFPTFVSVRYDIGAMWLVPETIKFQALVHGLGIGIGLKTPLGLARFAVGENFRFNQDATKPIDLNAPRFYFSIGANL
jgi:predicted acylesterase/phospholipase RssA/outer membrane translocation and assembly module TamA